MATSEDLKLFRAVYEGDLEALKQMVQDGVSIKDVNFLIKTDEICLCSTAFENLGLEFTNIASPSGHGEALRFEFEEDGSAECALQDALDASQISMTQSMCSVSRRVYEPPLYHWLETGQCSHLNARLEGEEDLLQDIEDSPETADVDDPATDIDLEVYGIRMSPYQIAEGVDQSINSGVREQIRRLSLAENVIDEGPESDELSISSGPSFHDNLDIMGLISQRPEEDEVGSRHHPSPGKYPYLQGLDPIDSEAGSCILVSDIKQAGVTPLHVAAARGHNDVITYLLERGCQADLLSTDAEETPLHLAVRWGRCSTAKLLLEKGANTHKLSAMECSPMHVAIELSCHECLKAMLDHLPADSTVDLATKQILLVYALSRDEVVLAKVLLDKFDIDVNAPLPEGLQTLLHKAAMCGASRCTQLLLERGASLNATSAEGEAPIHVAAATGHVECIQELLRAGAKCTAVPNWMIGDNQTPLMLAAYNNYPDAVMSLIAHDDVNTASEYGDTALHYASYRGCEESVSALLSAGASVNARNDYGATPLWNGACYSEIVKLLLQHGATLHVTSVGHNLDHVQGPVYNHPYSPLEIALEEGFLDSAQALLLAGARISRVKALALLEDTQARYGMETPSGKVFVDNIKQLLSTVPTLKCSARCTIMDCVADQAPCVAIQKLPLEQKLKAFMQFDDI